MLFGGSEKIKETNKRFPLFRLQKKLGKSLRTSLCFMENELKQRGVSGEWKPKTLPMFRLQKNKGNPEGLPLVY